MLNKLKLKIKKQAENWYWLLFFTSFVIGVMTMFYVAKQEDAEMRRNLNTYAKTIERSIDWRPHAPVLNTKPSDLTPSALSDLEKQLNSACKANQDCHFIYLLYKEGEQVKFLLDASPQATSEISQLGDVFEEATVELKQAMESRQSLVEGPIKDRWGNWVSVRMPIKSTVQPPHFAMLNIDVAVNNWNARILKVMLAPALTTLMFLGILGGFIYHTRKREKLLTQLYDSTSALSEIANNDALTGLPNRRLLEDRMMQALKSARRSDNIVAVLFLDLDYFKAVNDTYGHLAGDELLKLVAMRLKHSIRAEDTVARIGGDEFVILLPTLTDMQQAMTMADKVINDLAQPFVTSAQAATLGVSIGIAFYPAHADEPSDLIIHADIAMYVAKRKGRNCYAIYQPD